MKKIGVTFTFLAITAMMMTSCGKYEEGPVFSLRTKTARLTGYWELVKATEKGITADLSGMKKGYTFIKGGEMKVTTSMLGMTSSFKGEWRFDDSKEILETRIFEGTEWNEWETAEILRLTNSELWLRDEYTKEGETYTDVLKLEKH